MSSVTELPRYEEDMGFITTNEYYLNQLPSRPGSLRTVVNISGNSTNSLSYPYAGTTNPFPASSNPPHNVQFVLPDVAFMFTSGCGMLNSRAGI